jgi:hypothetical protein
MPATFGREFAQDNELLRLMCAAGARRGLRSYTVDYGVIPCCAGCVLQAGCDAQVQYRRVERAGGTACRALESGHPGNAPAALTAGCNRCTRASARATAAIRSSEYASC